MLCIAVFFVTPLQIRAADPDPNESKLAQMEAMQFGEYFGAAASMYDVCVSKGLIAKGPRSAEQQAEEYIETSEQTAKFSKYVHLGWTVARQRMLTELAPDYYENHCQLLAGQWEKYRVMLKLK